jgi:hypothetical protein
MGHYASEMACSACRNCRCSCPPPPDNTREHWVIDFDYSVIPAYVLEAKYAYTNTPFGRIPDKGMGRLRRTGCKHYATEEEAKTQAILRLQADLAKSEEQTAKLAARLQELQAV